MAIFNSKPLVYQRVTERAMAYLVTDDLPIKTNKGKLGYEQQKIRINLG
jgi:hypothetical protein